MNSLKNKTMNGYFWFILSFCLQALFVAWAFDASLLAVCINLLLVLFCARQTIRLNDALREITKLETLHKNIETFK